ncbi:MAG TPA: hypothetical protein VFG51_00105 [Candidatus Saccharimonadia bacterium]|nr:hypothetical protein [Candidatus Saccharimonadia bacterium]
MTTDDIRFAMRWMDGDKLYGVKHVKGDAWTKPTGGANDHYEEQQHEANHFVPTDGETEAERNQ